MALRSNERRRMNGLERMGNDRNALGSECRAGCIVRKPMRKYVNLVALPALRQVPKHVGQTARAVPKQARCHSRVESAAIPTLCDDQEAPQPRLACRFKIDRRDEHPAGQGRVDLCVDRCRRNRTLAAAIENRPGANDVLHGHNMYRSDASWVALKGSGFARFDFFEARERILDVGVAAEMSRGNDYGS